MTWLFPAEIEAHNKGWIDDFGFISNYQRQCLAPQLQDINSFREFDYHPYFNFKRIPWQYRDWNGTYQIGRISRDDGAKFANDTWKIFERVIVPKTLAKKIYILGYGPNAAEKTGPAPPALDWLTWAPNAIDSTEFYRTVDTMIHKTGGSGESYSMILLEAYAHGVVPIVEENYAFPELVVHGETGFMTNDSDEMSYYASQLAWSREKHQRMARNGRKYLENSIIDENKSWSCWKKLS
jgi:glycosyltransferase involved in cell wall biosynthesis